MTWHGQKSGRCEPEAVRISRLLKCVKSVRIHGASTTAVSQFVLRFGASDHVFQQMISEAKVPSSDRSYEGDTCSILLSEEWWERMRVATTSPQRVAQGRVRRHIHLHAEWIYTKIRRV